MSVEHLDLSLLGFARPFVDLARGEGRAAGLLGGGPAALDKSEERVPGPISPAVAAALVRLADQLEAPEPSRQNLARLHDGAPAVVTGQQPGLLGGPLFTLQLKSGIVEFDPFWLLLEPCENLCVCTQ